MFGKISLIEKIDRQMVSKEQYLSNKNNRVFYTGGLYHHIDNKFGVNINRSGMYNQISKYITNPGQMDNNTFIKFIKESKYSIDLLGAGNPNIRTFEILVSGSLMLQQKNNLIWPFSEKFSEECYFENSNEFAINLQKLESNNDLYKECLLNQYQIVNKYFNKEWLKNYIIQKFNI
jgi:spore maturation protein CgeB